MRNPERLQSLVDQGVIDSVLRPLMSGKEADVFLVFRHGEAAVAKVYKEAEDRSFRQRIAYTEGRKVRNTRMQRAIDRGSAFGKEQIEDGWRNAEVDTIHRLRAAEVRVPEPLDYVDGVLVMELIMDGDGEAAPRLCDLSFDTQEAEDLFQYLLGQMIRMLLAGVVHGDLSDFNILVAWDGPVIIDFPQSVDPAANRSGRKLLIRDVDNVARFLGRFAPRLLKQRYGEEMWSLYERNALNVDTVLTGRFAPSERRADTSALLRELEDVERDVRARRSALGLSVAKPARAPVVYEPIPVQQKGPRQDRGARPPRGPGPVQKNQGRPPPRNEPRPPERTQPAPPDVFADIDSLLDLGD